MKNQKKKKKKSFLIPDLKNCKVCTKGACCREGVETDLFEVARILEMKLDIPKPWFDYLGRDKTFPSGYKFSTRLKKRKCIFQDDNMRCLVYQVRPRYCSEFPYEDGKIAYYYGHLCHHPKTARKKLKQRWSRR